MVLIFKNYPKDHIDRYNFSYSICRTCLKCGSVGGLCDINVCSDCKQTIIKKSKSIIYNIIKSLFYLEYVLNRQFLQDLYDDILSKYMNLIYCSNRKKLLKIFFN